jgi:hypothetical protein
VAGFECNVTIVNDTPYDLALTDSGVTSGYWMMSPPATISAYETAPPFILADKSGGAFGSEGYVHYGAVSPASGTFEIHFYDPANNNRNSCSISNPGSDRYSVCFIAKTDGDPLNNKCPPNGKPLTMTFYIRTLV